jgi:DNA-binding transcriptional ArsR family regulator
MMILSIRIDIFLVLCYTHLRQGNTEAPEMTGITHHHPSAPPMPEALRLLSDETRWRLIGELRWSDRQVGELCERLDLPQNLVSYHLGVLRQARLVRTHRSDADGRVLYYALDLAALQQQWQSIGSALALGHTAPPAVDHRSGAVRLHPQQRALTDCRSMAAAPERRARDCAQRRNPSRCTCNRWRCR